MPKYCAVDSANSRQSSTRRGLTTARKPGTVALVFGTGHPKTKSPVTCSFRAAQTPVHRRTQGPRRSATCPHRHIHHRHRYQEHTITPEQADSEVTPSQMHTCPTTRHSSLKRNSPLDQPPNTSTIMMRNEQMIDGDQIPVMMVGTIEEEDKRKVTRRPCVPLILRPASVGASDTVWPPSHDLYRSLTW